MPAPNSSHVYSSLIAITGNKLSTTINNKQTLNTEATAQNNRGNVAICREVCRQDPGYWKMKGVEVPGRDNGKAENEVRRFTRQMNIYSTRPWPPSPRLASPTMAYPNKDIPGRVTISGLLT